ncbi:MAG TPA: ComF family protein [Chloroflexia bacterium]|nr:ComF family protein [Chloroflexia bacterium]
MVYYPAMMYRNRQASQLFLSAWDRLLDLLYPPRCGGCDRRGTLFCDACLLAVTVPIFDREDVAGVGLLISAGTFDGPLRTAIHNFKYESDTPLAKPLAQVLSNVLARDESAELDGDPLALVPVPLHIERRKARGYNQSELLARELSKLTGWGVMKGLERVRETRSQVGLSAQERRENMQGAFAWRGDVVPQRVLLIDDVCTSGATLSECAIALQKAGVEEVYAATVAKAINAQIDIS